MDGETLRTRLSAELKSLKQEALVELGSSIAQGGCWGTLVGDLERICTENDDYLALFDILVQLKEARALLLFVMAVRKKPAIFEHVARRADELPRTVQCALVSLPDFDEISRTPRETLCAAAREVLLDPIARTEARIEYEAHTGHLRSMDWGRL
jgi:hypothetical protein